MLFFSASLFQQVVAMLALAVLAVVAGGWCWRTSRAYAHWLNAGGQADAAGLAMALRCAAGVRWRRVWRVASIAVCTTVVFGYSGFMPYALLVCVACTMLLLLALIDARTRLLPDALTLPLLWLGLTVAWMGWGTVTLHAALAGVMAGYGFLWFLQQCFQRLRGVDGMGQGDMKLLAALGSWLGWQALPWLVLVACVAGLGFAMWRQKTVLPAGAYPFGPFLAASGAGVFILGSEVHLWF